MPLSLHRLLALSCLLLGPALAQAEEGMWTYEAFPADAVAKAYGFKPTQAWLDRLRLASLRLSNGCSGSFVSPQGLVLTNHHCVRSCLEDLSSRKQDLMQHGFLAKTLKDEKRCPRLELTQLLATSDVTERVNNATRNLKGADFHAALKAESADIEGACATSADLRCEVVALHHGGRYHLYRYKRFQDVRLAFVPELEAAAFGGDPDNFNFPRYAFDVALLRVWNGAKPLGAAAYFPWSSSGAKEGQLTFVSGSPGGTEREITVAELEFQRDVALPLSLLFTAEMRGMLEEYSRKSKEAERITQSRLRSVENSLKALRGRQQALADPALMRTKREAEVALRAGVLVNSPLKTATATAWDEVAKALDVERTFYLNYRMLEGRLAFQSELFDLARHLVRASEELEKPNGERLREYSETQLPVLRQQILRDAPIEKALEQQTLTFSLLRMREALGADHPFVQRVLGKESPELMAARLIQQTSLQEAAVREKLLAGGRKAVLLSKDPLILLARKVDDDARALRKRYDDEVEAVLRKNAERIAQAKRVVRGSQGAPDATSTLRLSYGTIKGWKEGERSIPPLTVFSGAYARQTGQAPFLLPASWRNAEGSVPGAVPLNMSSTHDVIGGNSGSPMVDTAGQLVGLIFDGNLPSLGGRYAYRPETNRSVSVHSEGLLSALDSIYRAHRLVREIRASQTPSASP